MRLASESELDRWIEGNGTMFGEIVEIVKQAWPQMAGAESMRVARFVARFVAFGEAPSKVGTVH